MPAYDDSNFIIDDQEVKQGGSDSASTLAVPVTAGDTVKSPRTPTPLAFSSRSQELRTSNGVPSSAKAGDTDLPEVLKRPSILAFLLSEKKIAGQPQQSKKRHRRRNSSYRILSGKVERLLGSERHVPLVVTGQLIILGLAWSFFVLVWIKGPVALPIPFAAWAQNNPQLMIFVVTLVATILSLISSSLLSLSMRYLINYYLCKESMTVLQLGVGMQILNRTLVMDRRHIRWSFTSVAILVLLVTMIASWATLIMPIRTVVNTNLSGVDLAIDQDTLLQNILDAIANSNSSELGSPPLNSPVIQLGALAAARAAAGLPSDAWMLNGWLFNATTGGIYPPLLNNTQLTPLMVPSLQNSNSATEFAPMTPFGLPGNFTIDDQTGFTAVVNCRLQNFSTPTAPQIRGVHAFVDGTSISDALGVPNNQSTGLNLWRWSTTCDDGGTVSSEIFSTFTNSTAVGLVCAEGPPTTVPSDYTLLIKTEGPLEPTFGSYSCSIEPRITSSTVDYAKVVQVRHADPLNNVSGNALAAFAIAALQQRFVLSQSLYDNVFTTGILDIVEEVRNNGGTTLTNAQLMRQLLQGYVQGHIEASISVLRAYIFEHKAAFQASYDELLQSPNTGNFHIVAMGLSPQPSALPIVLLPISLVPLISISLVLFVLFKRMRPSHLNPRITVPNNLGRTSIDREIAVEQEQEIQDGISRFDVGNPFHLLAVASAGGITGVCGGRLAQGELKLSQAVRLRVGRVQNHADDSMDVGLVHEW